MRQTLLLLTLLGIVASTNLMVAQSPSQDTTFWVTDGGVDAAINDAYSMYIGGNFNLVGPQIRYGAVVDSGASVSSAQMVRPNGVVKVAIPDGTGGWYIGGAFTMVGGVARSNIARINSNGTLNSWSPSFNSDVLCLSKVGNTIYAGGLFTTVNGQTHRNLVAIDEATATPTAWSPVVNPLTSGSSSVTSLAVKGNTVYIIGNFHSVGGLTRNSLAAVDKTTGSVSAWNPNITSSGNVPLLKALAVSDTTIYIGGTFNNVGSVARTNLVAIDSATGSPLSWSPNPSGAVANIIINGTKLYIGGSFSTVSGSSRTGLASFDLPTRTLTSWAPSCMYPTQLAVSGNTVYVGGGLMSVNGQDHFGFQAINAVSGLSLFWSPNVSGTVNAIAFNGNHIYLGGSFNIIGGVVRHNLAQFNISTGALLPFNINPTTLYNTNSSEIDALASNGTTLYISGTFTSVAGQPRNHFAAVDLMSGQLTAWNPNGDQGARSLVLNGNSVYAGGDFNTIGGQTRLFVAEIDATTGIPTSWNPGADASVNVLSFSTNSVYIGGAFGNIGGQSRSFLAEVSLGSGVATAWNPSPDGVIYAIRDAGTALYIGGDYTMIAGVSIPKFAIINKSTGTAQNFNLGFNAGYAGVNDIALGNRLYLGGNFYQPANNLSGFGSFNISSGLSDGWNPGNMGISKLVVSGTYLYQFYDNNSFFIGNRRFSLFPAPTVNITSAGNTLTANVNGGTAPYTYYWSYTGGTTASITTIGCGIYTVTVTDANSATATASYATFTGFSAVLTSVATTCGAPNGSLSAVVTGGTPPYDYYWSTGVYGYGQSSITALSGGAHTVTVTDASNCTVSASAVVAASTGFTLSAAHTNVTCTGSANGAVYLSIAGSGNAYTYNWSNGATTSSLSNLNGGIYSVTVSDGTCSAGTTVTVTEPTAPLSVADSLTMPSCSCQCGAINITTSGGTAPYSYFWYNGQATQNLSGLGSGTYALVVTDANGCSVSHYAVLSGSQLVQLSETHTSQICTSASASIDLTVTGTTAPYAYQWSNGATVQDPIGLTAGVYSVTVTDVNGCIASLSTTVNSVNPLAVTTSHTPSCPFNSTGTQVITTVAGLPPYSLAWSSGNTSIAATGGSYTISSLSAGAHSYSVTDANGCLWMHTDSLPAIYYALQPVVTAACGTNLSGSINAATVGGIPPLTYQWSGGVTTSTPILTSLSAGMYTVTATDSNGCSASAQAIVGTGNITTSVQSYPACNGVLNGEILLTVTGNYPPYQYSWSNGTLFQDLQNIGAGNYTVTITDAGSCFATASATVGSGFITVGLAGPTIVCPGVAAPLSAYTNTPGANLYTWSYNAVTSPNLIAPGPGTYSVTLTTPNNCTASASIVVNGQAVCTNLPPNAVHDSYNVYQNGVPFTGNVLNNDSDPELNTMIVSLTPQVNTAHGLLVLSGSGSFTYTPDPNYIGLDSFVYTVCDNGTPNACATASVYLHLLACNLSATASATASCGNNGTGTVVVTGGAAPYSYLWSDGETTTTASGLTPGTVVVTVTDANGCRAVATTAVPYVQGFSIVLTPSISSCSNNYCVLMASGGQSYQWSNGQQAANIVVTQPGWYYVTATSGLCTVVDSIVASPYLSVAIHQTPDCNAGQNAVSVNVSGTSTGPYTFQWSNNAVGAAINLPTGNYTLTVTDITGCQIVKPVVVNTMAQFSVSAQQHPDTCNLGTGSLNAMVTGNYSGVINWVWSNGTVGHSANGLHAGVIYTVTATDALGCSASLNTNVNAANTLSVSLAVQPSSCAYSTGAATVNINGNPHLPLAYNWSDGSSSATVNTLASGPVAVTVTDALGCIATATGSITSQAMFSIQVATSPQICGQAGGTAQVTVLGSPSGTLQYHWSNNASGVSAINGLSAGNYMVTVTDASACPQIAGFTIQQANPFNIAIVKNPAICGSASGTANAIVTGTPNGQLAYQWSTGAMNQPALSNLPVGNYSLTATDAAGCSVTMPFQIVSSSSLYGVIANSTDSRCGLPTGTANVTGVYGSPVGTLSYQWSSGQTTSAIASLVPGAYTVTVSDSYCSASTNVWIGDLNWVNPILSTSYVQCANPASGSATVNLPAYMTNPTYQWSNGQTTATANLLTEGWYSVTVTGGNTCYGHGNLHIERDPACNVHIVGRVVDDSQLQSCVMAAQPGIVNKLVRCTGPNNYDQQTWTAPGGYYSFTAPGPGTYSIQLLNSWDPFELPYVPVCGAVLNTNLPNYGSWSVSNHFYLKLNDTIRNLLTVVSSNGVPRPSVPRTYTVSTRNLGGALASGHTALTWDSLLVNPVPFTSGSTLDLVNHTATWPFTNLSPGSWVQKNISLSVQNTTAINTPIASTGVSTPVQGDHWPLNNYFVYNQIVSNSFDPNDKAANLGREIPLGDSVMVYTIRFQNTGTDTAYSIVVTDTLDANVFDINSLTPLSSSHPYHTARNGNVVSFYFENIYLVDSFHNEPASHGFVMFAIRLRDQLNAGAFIRNKASIYFDYNDPVVTNTAVNELVTGIYSPDAPDVHCSIYPNPTQGGGTLRYELPETTNLCLEITDALGRKVWSENRHGALSGVHYETLPVLPAGIWNVSLRSEHYTIVKKWVSISK